MCKPRYTRFPQKCLLPTTEERGGGEQCWLVPDSVPLGSTLRFLPPLKPSWNLEAFFLRLLARRYAFSAEGAAETQWELSASHPAGGRSPQPSPRNFPRPAARRLLCHLVSHSCALSSEVWTSAWRAVLTPSTCYSHSFELSLLLTGQSLITCYS